MALDLTARYPAQIETNVDYPYGKAQNIAVAGDGTGTPWEKDLVNDLLGFQQKLLTVGDVTPSGTPDSVAASQYFDALLTAIQVGRHDVPLIAVLNTDDRFQGGADFGIYQQIDVTDTGELDFHIALPKIGTLKLDEVHAIVSGTSITVGAHAALPATLPHVFLARRPITPGATIVAHTILADQVDLSANVGDYNEIHLISATGLASVIGDYAYTVGFTGEAGANSEADKLTLLGIYCVLTP